MTPPAEIQEPVEVKTLNPRRVIKGELKLPGDKSISHRAALLSALCDSPLEVHNYSDGEDCQRSLKAAKALGVAVSTLDEPNGLILTPPQSLNDNVGIIECGNSGTTARLLAGLLAGLGAPVELRGDESLSRRPMKRVIEPLVEMGGRFESERDSLPLKILGGASGSIDYRMPVASAQVKSALLFAALTGGGRAIITEDIVTRDHSERMLRHLGAPIERLQPRLELRDDPNDPRKKMRVIVDDWKAQVTLKGGSRLRGGKIDVPGDISTAAFFFAAAAIGKGEVKITDVGLNPTRTAFLDYLRSIGCDVTISDKVVHSEEPRGAVTVCGGDLKGRKIHGATTAALIDEIPIISVIACFADGPTVIRDAGELRVKESDRIEAMAMNLRKMGARVGALEDGLAMESNTELQPADFDSFGDHRIAMALSIASLFLSGASSLRGAECVSVSCPKFYDLLSKISS